MTKEVYLHMYEEQMHEAIHHANFCAKKVRELRADLYGEHHFDLLEDDL